MFAAYYTWVSLESCGTRARGCLGLHANLWPLTAPTPTPPPPTLSSPDWIPRILTLGFAAQFADDDVARFPGFNATIATIALLCPPGRWSTTDSSPCSPCPPGYSCAAGTRNPTGVPCPVGSFSSGSGSGACTPCPAGRYGASTGLTTSACSGPCVASPGSGCPASGSTSPTGVQCIPGTYGLGGKGAVCTPCAIGQYGTLAGAASQSCSGVCVAAPGWGCPAGGTRATGVQCVPGTYSPGGSVDCEPCPAGKYSASAGAVAVGSCQPCAATPGSPCSLGGTRPNGTPCAPGTFASSSVACRDCPAFTYGAAAGLATSSCSGACVAPEGYGCPAKLQAPGGTPCPPGRYSSFALVWGGIGDGCADCPQGRFGDAPGGSNATCTGACVSEAGHVCLAGATNATGTPCPKGTYSAAGATKCILCPIGQYTDQLGSLACMPCPIGRYGSFPGAADASCSGNCLATAKYVCGVTQATV